MTHENDNEPDNGSSRFTLTRRDFLKTSAAGAVVLTAPAIITSRAWAAGEHMDLGSFEKADIDWRMAEGAEITVGVIPAGYFDNLDDVLEDFETLTGIDVRLEKIPPGQIRQKAVQDLSSKTGTYATHAADPMYYALYVENGWIDPVERYLDNDKLTDNAWFDYEDILEAWRGAVSVDGKPYGIPYDGEATIQVYRKDVYDELGLKPAETLEEYMTNAEKAHDPDNRLYGAALRGFRGAGQNMYIFPSLYRAWGGKWFNEDGTLTVNNDKAVAALEYYIRLLNNYSPSGVSNWNWPDIADAFGQGTVASYIDAHSSAAVLNNEEKSKVIDKIGYARWPKGPAGKRVSSIWNWSFPINAALPDKDKQAVWLFIQWAASKEVQYATSSRFEGAYKRTGVNRASVWEDAEYRKVMEGYGHNFLDATTTSLEEDTDVDWRPRLPQWPAVGDTMATAIQSALVGESEPKDALDRAQEKIDGMVRPG